MPSNLSVIPPVYFSEMLDLYARTELIITDSGGIQEEAAYLGIPALILRAKTERLESIRAGIAKYVSGEENLDDLISELNHNRSAYTHVLYGDGHASGRIMDFLQGKYFESDLLNLRDAF